MACSSGEVSGCEFTSFLVHQTPIYDKLILEDIRPEDGWILHVDTGTFPAYNGTTHYLDRFNHVWPNVTKQWNTTQAGNCLGTPCDKTEYCIGWGATRVSYYLEEQSWRTPLLCYDQNMHITHAKEHFRQIIGSILKPATSAVMSNFLRKRVADHAEKKWVASAGMTDFTFAWVTVGDEELYIDTDVPPSSKLTPQMLQRRVQPLMQKGYFGKQPFKDMPPLIELVTDLETCWELDKLATSGGTPSVSGNWRFTQWDAANAYWKYSFSGQIGNYAVRVDPFALRFNYVGLTIAGLYRYQVVLPYRNVPSSGAGTAAGLKDQENPDYQKAQYQFSYIWHRKALQCLVSDATPINPEMPFSARDFGGKWQFVMDNLGSDCNGVAIENKRRNKGMFIADFKLAIRPQYVEFAELIFHKREPACVIAVDVCNADPGYPTQTYESCNDACDSACP